MRQNDKRDEILLRSTANEFTADSFLRTNKRVPRRSLILPRVNEDGARCRSTSAVSEQNNKIVNFRLTICGDGSTSSERRVNDKQLNGNNNKIIEKLAKIVASRLRHVSRFGSFYLTYHADPEIVDMPLTLIIML